MILKKITSTVYTLTACLLASQQYFTLTMFDSGSLLLRLSDINILKVFTVADIIMQSTNVFNTRCTLYFSTSIK